MARPSSYDPKTWPKRAYSLASRGMSDTQIANKLGVILETLRSIQKKHPELKDAIDNARSEWLSEVEGTLKRDILGYFVEEVDTDIRHFRGAKTVMGEKVHKKWIPPNAQLKKLVLQAIAPEKYGKIDSDTNINTNVQIVQPVQIVFGDSKK